MTTNAIVVFDKDDEEYQQWADEHLDAYVINTTRVMDGSCLTVHRTNCRLVRQYNNMAKPGGFTERKLIKVCSEDLEALREWAERHGERKKEVSELN